MDHEEAKTTRKLRVRCLCCRRALRDAVSLVIGVGPVCRKQYDYVSAPMSEAQRYEANQILLELAQDDGPPDVDVKINRLHALGLHTIATLVLDRLVAVHIEARTIADRTFFAVRSPYRAEAIAAWRAIPSRRWQAEEHVNLVDVEDEPALRALISRFYPGTLAVDVDGTASRVPWATGSIAMPADVRRYTYDAKRGAIDALFEEGEE